MMTTHSYSPTLFFREDDSGGKTLSCRSCAHAVCEADGNWKEHAILDEQPLREIGQASYASAGPDVMLRRFYCPGCGATLDAETALRGEPFLVDTVKV